MHLSRKLEWALLPLVFLPLTLGYVVVWQSYLPAWQEIYHGKDWQIFLPLGGMLLGWILVSLVLTFQRCRETIVMPLVALLCGIGLLFLLRLAGGTFLFMNEDDGMRLFLLYQKQLISLGVALALLISLLLFLRDYRYIARYKYLIATIAVILLLATTFAGKSTGGQTLSLHLLFVTFQPHDLVKLLLVIFMAAYLVDKQELISFAAGRYGLITLMDFRYMGPMVALWIMIMAIIFRHDDLGAALLIFGAFLGMLYLGTERKVYVIIGMVLFIAGGIAAYSISPRVQTRVAIWQNPWKKADTDGYQIVQSMIALGNGRVVGAGLAAGVPERIPARHTDMIYSVISEDLGLLGAMALLLILLTLIGRIFIISLRVTDRFGKLLASGLATTLALQIFIIIGGNIKLIPLTGITLPFISYGGTSLVVNLLLIALVLKVAEERGN